MESDRVDSDGDRLSSRNPSRGGLMQEPMRQEKEEVHQGLKLRIHKNSIKISQPHCQES